MRPALTEWLEGLTLSIPGRLQKAGRAKTVEAVEGPGSRLSLAEGRLRVARGGNTGSERFRTRDPPLPAARDELCDRLLCGTRRL